MVRRDFFVMLWFARNVHVDEHFGTVLVFVGDMNNGIKKETLTKDATRLWINDGIKMQTFSHSLVNTLFS